MNILAGDIGGTKTLLGIYSLQGTPIPIYKKKYLSSDWSTLERLLTNFIENIPKEINHPKIGCLGLAGPVNNGLCSITNLGWEINQEDLSLIAGLDKLELVNDISALIYGIPFLRNNQYVQIQSGEPKVNKNSPIAIIAAGTGLGMARGLHSADNIQIFPSEGGHREFSPRSAKEWELGEWLISDLNLKRLSIERVVSVNGLGNIGRWRLNKPDAISHPLRKVSEKWKYNKQENIDLPALVSEAAKIGDQLMEEVLTIWLSAYGSAAGDLAIHELCQGGLWIGGGAAYKHLEGIRSATFLESFKCKGRFANFLEKLPVMVLVDPEAGLFSAACRAHVLAESDEKLK